MRLENTFPTGESTSMTLLTRCVATVRLRKRGPVVRNPTYVFDVADPEERQVHSPTMMFLRKRGSMMLLRRLLPAVKQVTHRVTRKWLMDTGCPFDLTRVTICPLIDSRI